MLIGIDGNEANIKERVGVNVWAFEVLQSLAKIANSAPHSAFTLRRALRARPQSARLRGSDVAANFSEEKFGSVRKQDYQFLVYLSKRPFPDLPPETENWHYRVIPPAKFWTRWRLPLDLYVHRFKGSDLSGRSDPLRRPDVFLSLSHYAPKWAPMPRVVSIMDLSFLKFPEAFKPAVLWQLKHWTEESVRNATHVITISEFNKREIIKNYHYPEERITVVYPGVTEIFKGSTLPRQGRTLRDAREEYGIRKKYLLFVGTLQQKKNLPRLIEAFGLIQKRFPDVQLVIAGKVWGQFAQQEQGTRNKEQVKYVGYVPERELPSLVAGAEVLVLPSLYEGFGIPAVEAMSVGTPVAASNTTSLPEIVGDSGILFDPYDIKDMADKICRLLAMNKVERQRLAEKGKIRARKFSWEKAGEKVLNLLMKAVS